MLLLVATENPNLEKLAMAVHTVTQIALARKDGNLLTLSLLIVYPASFVEMENSKQMKSAIKAKAARTATAKKDGNQLILCLSIANLSAETESLMMMKNAMVEGTVPTAAAMLNLNQ